MARFKLSMLFQLTWQTTTSAWQAHEFKIIKTWACSLLILIYLVVQVLKLLFGLRKVIWTPLAHCENVVCSNKATVIKSSHSLDLETHPTLQTRNKWIMIKPVHRLAAVWATSIAFSANKIIIWSVNLFEFEGVKRASFYYDWSIN